MANVRIKVDRANLDARLERLRQVLSSGQAAKAGGIEMEGHIKDHIGRIARTRHSSAYSLGATPTGHYREEAVNLRSTNANSATVAVSIPGIARAYRDITIRPRKTSALTIPIHAWAYGATVRELKDEGMPVFRLPKTDVLATVDDGGALVALYLLRKLVHQPRDRSLMPADEALKDKFVDGVQMAIDHYGDKQ